MFRRGENREASMNICNYFTIEGKLGSLQVLLCKPVVQHIT